MNRGDVAYIIVSNYRIEEVKIIRIEGNLITVKLSSGGAIRLPRGRIYESMESAEDACRSRQKKRPNYMGPYE